MPSPTAMTVPPSPPPNVRAPWLTALRALRAGSATAALVLMQACGGGGSAASTGPESMAPLSAAARLGEQLFNDGSLSASGRLACASCHAAASGHAAPNALPAQQGGPLLDRQGARNAGSIRYLSYNTAFHFAADGTPTGGFFWDGRAASLAEQAVQPLLGSVEMANADAADFTRRLANASYAAAFRAEYGADILERPAAALAAAALALQQYQREDAELHAFTSRFDEFLRGRATLTPSQLRGLALFNDPAKGNCAACHPSTIDASGRHPLFTDFSYDNLGIPRNPALLRNADPGYFDLGLCQRLAGDLADRTDLCGAFRVPSLRNVALRHAYFHNGRFTTLKEALTFYVQRDIHPERWYPLRADGMPDLYDDLPATYRGNVNRSEAPYDRRPGDAPALSDAEISDVIEFLQTLSDGYAP